MVDKDLKQYEPPSVEEVDTGDQPIVTSPGAVVSLD